MELFRRILSTAVEGGASDVHIKVGNPIVFRINRKLIAIESPVPTLAWMETIIKNILPKHLLKRYEEDHEIDFSYF